MVHRPRLDLYTKTSFLTSREYAFLWTSIRDSTKYTDNFNCLDIYYASPFFIIFEFLPVTLDPGVAVPS